MTRLLLLVPISALLASGCHTTVVTNPPPPPPGDVASPMGARGVYGYHVANGVGLTLPTNDIGYGVTASGTGNYNLGFSDPGASVYFSGTISSDTGISNPVPTPVAGSPLQVIQNADGSVSFQNGVTGDQITVTANSEPIYLDLFLNNNPLATGGFGVYFIGAVSGQLINDITYDPIAFTSP